MGELILLAVPFFVIVALLNLAMDRRMRRRGLRRSVQPPRISPDHTFDPASSSTFLGGGCAGRRRATAPLVRLRIDEDWARLGGFVSTWIDRAAVVRVEDITAVLSTGVRFATDDGRYDGVVFWTNQIPEVLHAFRHHGWPVEDQRVPPPT